METMAKVSKRLNGQSTDEIGRQTGPRELPKKSVGGFETYVLYGIGSGSSTEW